MTDPARPTSLLARRNPLRMAGTSLGTGELLAAKALLLCFLLGGFLERVPEVFLPLLPALEPFTGSSTYVRLLQAAIAVPGLLLWLNVTPRACCTAIGAAMLLADVSSAPAYHENLLYTALVFLLLGLAEGRSRPAVLRTQLAIVYLGAGLNKALDPDWRSGAFLRSWLSPEHYPTGRVFEQVWDLVPHLDLALVLGWSAFLLELALGALLLHRRTAPMAVFVSAVFHAALVLATGGRTFLMFWYALTATYLALLRWPGSLQVVWNPRRSHHRLLHALLRPLDPDRRTTWVVGSGGLALDIGHDRWHGATALAWLLVYTPAFTLACAVAFLAPEQGTLAIPVVMSGLLLPIAWGWFAARGQRLRKDTTAVARARAQRA